MATLEQLGEALRRADAAGNAQDAKALAQAIRGMQQPTQQAQPAQPAQPRSLMQGIGDYAAGLRQGAYRVPQSLIEIGARGTDALGLTEGAFPATKDIFQRSNQAALPSGENKYTKTGDVVGQVLATAPVAALKVAQGSTLLPAALNAGTQGMTAAALTSSASDAPLPQQLATGFGLGLLGGTAAHGVGKGIESLARPRVPAPPTVPQLRSQGDAMYKVANGAGVVIRPERWTTFVDDVRVKMGKVNPKLYPKASGIMDELDAAAQNPAGVTLEEADQLRQIAGDVLSSPERGERRLAHVVIDSLDDYVDQIGAADVVSGDPRAATSILTHARDLWARKSKGEAIERLVTRAKTRSSQFSGSGYENALRTEFRNFSLNERAMRRFSSAEQDAIRHVSEGGKPENVLRMLGKFAPTGVVSSVLSAGAGASAGGVPGAVALPLAGLAARQGATALTNRNATLASELMRRGGPAPVMPVDPRALALIEALRGIPVAPALGAVVPANQ